MLNTNQIYNEAGTGAPDFPMGMPTVGGDPIVESGSNSDGSWTRWADGTQHCEDRHNFGNAAVYGNGSLIDLYRSDTFNAQFSASFLDVPKVVFGHACEETNSRRICGSTCGRVYADRIDTWQVYRFEGSTSDVISGYVATGRWK